MCGRFEGIDERVIEPRHFEEVSVGDYVLSGGEIAAMALLDACVRLVAGRHGQGGLRAPRRASARACSNIRNITRPQHFEGHPIPEVLSSGDHAKIAAWRRAEAERLTRERRPDLWEAYLARSGTPKNAGPKG